MKNPDIKNNLIGITIGLTVALIMIFLNNAGFLDQYEAKLLDFKFNIANRLCVKPSSNIKIIGIDDASVAKIGRWPWKRGEHSKIIDFLKLYGAKAVVYDVFFTYRDLADQASDKNLVHSAKKAGNIYFASKFIAFDQGNSINTEDRDVILQKSSIMADINKYKDTSDFTNKGIKIRYEIPFEELANSSKGIGLVHIGEQNDGTVRYQDLIYKYNSRFYPSLSLIVAMDNLNTHKVESYNKDYTLGNIKIPLDEKGRMIVNWNAKYDKKRSIFRSPYEQYSAWRFIESYDNLVKASKACGLSVEKFKEILDKVYLAEKQEKTLPQNIIKILNKIPSDFELKFGGDNPSDIFRDKIVLVGVASTSTTMRDNVSTPVLKDIPGVYIHANVLDNILSNNFISKVSRSATNLIMLFVGIIVGLLVFGLKDSIKGITYPLILILLYVFVVFLGFIKFNLWIDSIYTLSTMVITFTLCSAIDYIIKDKEESKIRLVMSNYISPQIMEEVLSDPSKLKLGGSKKEITILFSDIRGFTSLSEEKDPQEVVSVLNQYLSNMVDLVFINNGTFDKFIGDAIMAFWNAPVETEDHEFLAVKTALEMVEKLKNLNKKFNLQGKTPIDIGIAVNTGEATIGNIGSEKIKDYTIIGDAVNLTSRLESLNKKYSTHIIISENTYERVKSKIEARFLDETEIKGKNKTVKIYEVLGIKK